MVCIEIKINLVKCRIPFNIPDSIIFGLIDQRINDLTATEILDNYIPYNNFPMGVVHHGNRLFIGLPRRRVGMPATLAFVSTNGSRGSSPSLQAFPDFRTNQLHVSLIRV